MAGRSWLRHIVLHDARGLSAGRGMSGPLLIADVPWLLYRSFFALPRSIRGADGKAVNALLGTLNAILNVLDVRPPGQAPRAVVACMGAEQADYRVRLYPPYHAHRDPMPEELAEQWPRIGELVRALGWTWADSDDLEADDVMFSHARAEQAAGGRALLLTGDRDLYGAVGERVAVIEMRKGGEHGLIDEDGVRERYGVGPGQVPDLIALRGDPSDGIPGAPGVGAKTAAELLRAFGSLDTVLEAAEAVLVEPPMRPRTAAVLREHAQLLRTFRSVATLQPIDVERPADARTDFAAGAQAVERAGMRRLAERLRALAAA